MDEDELPPAPLSVAEAVDALVTAGLLTEQQAECWVRRKVEAEPVESVADDLGVAEKTVYNVARRAQIQIDDARATVTTANRIRGFDPEEINAQTDSGSG